MKQQTKDRAIAAALIGAAATIIAPIAASMVESGAPDPPTAPQATTPVSAPEPGGGLGSGGEPGEVPQEMPEDDDQVCHDLGPYVVGTLCLSPPTSSPGDSYEVSGTGFPPATQFILNDYESPPQGVVTDSGGAFSATFTTDPMACKTYMISLLDESNMALGNILHEQPDC